VFREQSRKNSGTKAFQLKDSSPGLSWYGCESLGVTHELKTDRHTKTSLNMPGFSITLLLLPEERQQSDLILSLLDEPTETPGWKWSSRFPPAGAQSPSEISSTISATDKSRAPLKAPDPSAFILAVKNACNALIRAEPEITRMDTIAGDGDCGLTLKGGATAVLQAVKEGKVSGEDIVSSLIAISQVAEEQMGGTSGALFS